VGQNSGAGLPQAVPSEPSMEGVGIDVVRTAINAGLPLNPSEDGDYLERAGSGD